MTFRVKNPNLDDLSDDTLYHFGLSKSQFDFKQFSDVKFVCTGGSAGRFKMYADSFSKNLNIPLPQNISKSDRFCIYKAGPVLLINHGIGVPSMSIMLNETFKILHYAGVTDVTFIRIGTSGGIGLEPGTVVVSDGAVNSQLRESYDLDINGKSCSFKAELDQNLAEELYKIGADFNYKVVKGKTLCANDFYEGQMRLDGALCVGSEEEKFAFLQELQRIGVKNIEMECTGFASMTQRVGAKGAIVCVALVNRLNGDQVNIEPAKYSEFEMRPYEVVSKYIFDKIKAASSK